MAQNSLAKSKRSYVIQHWNNCYSTATVPSLCRKAVDKITPLECKARLPFRRKRAFLHIAEGARIRSTRQPRTTTSLEPLHLIGVRQGACIILSSLFSVKTFDMNEVKRQWAPIANRSIQEEVSSLSEAEREHFEERAGILQHQDGLAIAQAEAVALQQTKTAFRGGE